MVVFWKPYPSFSRESHYRRYTPKIKAEDFYKKIFPHGVALKNLPLSIEG